MHQATAAGSPPVGFTTWPGRVCPGSVAATLGTRRAISLPVCGVSQSSTQHVAELDTPQT